MSARKRVKHPRFNGYVCIVDGCARVEFKHELCRKHWQELPLQIRLGIMSDSMYAAMKASKRHDAEIRKWADNYATGTLAAQSKTAAAR